MCCKFLLQTETESPYKKTISVTVWIRAYKENGYNVVIKKKGIFFLRVNFWFKLIIWERDSLFLISIEIKLMNYSLLHKLFYSLNLYWWSKILITFRLKVIDKFIFLR